MERINNEIRALCDFDMIYDVDYGIIKTIVDNYNNKAYTNDDYLRTVTIEKLKEDMSKQTERDPLKLVFKEGFDYSSLYDEIYENEQELLVNNSIVTELFKMFIILEKMNLIKLDVICKNIYQEQRIKSSGFNHIYYDNIDLKNYDCLYIKSYKDLISLGETPENFTIYLANYKYNLSDSDEDSVLPRVDLLLLEYLLKNVIEFIDLY